MRSVQERVKICVPVQMAPVRMKTILMWPAAVII